MFVRSISRRDVDSVFLDSVRVGPARAGDVEESAGRSHEWCDGTRPILWQRIDEEVHGTGTVVG